MNLGEKGVGIFGITLLIVFPCIKAPNPFCRFIFAHNCWIFQQLIEFKYL